MGLELFFGAERNQSVIYGILLSTPKQIETGVPQESRF